MRKSQLLWLTLCVVSLCLTSCKDNKNVSDQTPPEKAIVPKVDADSAMAFVTKQLSFGVRVPGTAGHTATREWIVQTMKRFGAEVEVQEFKATFLTKKEIPAFNIIARMNPDAERRIALFAHWDTRLIAEKEADKTKQNLPIPGAIDGASGVAGLLEIARLMQQNPINLGIDFVFFDAEDQGDNQNNQSWCLGSQFWAKSVAEAEIKPEFGILLDLIGAKGATYSKEEISTRMAGSVQDKIWTLASAMNKGNLFVNAPIGQIMDDHFYVNTIAGIPTVDIIETKPSGYFADYHHTHQDNLDMLDKENLAAVIQVVTAVAYKTSDKSL
jgi:Zn-dependent M28 family amino/carboxypeptidase